MKKWEYMSVYSGYHYLAGDALNEHGKKGWELVSSHAAKVGSSYYFKREVKS